MKKIVCSFLFALTLMQGFAQLKTENLVIVTLDGFRWQEVFKGIDPVLSADTLYNRDPKGLREKFWAEDEKERRKKLLPFIWTTVAAKGQLYGNRTLGNNVDNANPYWFSYPGYNEIFTGYPDTAVNSNDKIWNKNENVLEFLHKKKEFAGKIAAFSTWDVFPYILNEQRSGIYVNADVDTIQFNQPGLQLLNDMQFLSTKPIGVRPDIITYMAAMEYFKAYQPRILYIAFDETDDFAHGGMYDQYIGSAHAEDAMIADIWRIIQSSPKYRNKTTLLITVDHGRGDKVKSNWKHHGEKIEDAHEIWLAAIGPDTESLGEIAVPGQLYQKQIAATIAGLLGYRFASNHPVAEPVLSVYKK